MSYLEALQRTQQSQDGTSSGYVETDIRKPKDPNEIALKKARYRRIFEVMTDAERKEMEKMLEKRERTRLEKAKPINKDFNKRARENQQRTEAMKETKEKYMSLAQKNKKAEEEKLIRKKEKEADKESRLQEKRDGTYVDFSSLGIYINEVDNRMEELQAELSLEERSYMAENAIADKDGNETLLPVQQKELDAKLEAIKRKMKNLEGERELQIQQRVNEIAFKALRKFNNPEEVARRFRDVGLLQYYLKYLENEQARIK
jgi:hypothetical protein